MTDKQTEKLIADLRKVGFKAQVITVGSEPTYMSQEFQTGELAERSFAQKADLNEN